MQRALDNQAERESAGSIPETTTITAHEALAWATIEGARMLCMEDRIGSITPGKQADLVLIGAGALNMQPVHDPVSAVVMQTSLANIDSVMVAGRWKKWGGRLLVDGLAGKIDRLRESGQRILQAMGLLANETVPDSQWRTILAECSRVAPHMALLFLPARGFVLANATKPRSGGSFADVATERTPATVRASRPRSGGRRSRAESRQQCHQRTSR
jgi:hypothetical protein